MICLKKKIKTEIILVKEKQKDNYWKKANYRTKFKKSKTFLLLLWIILNLQ